jgi:ABC-type arginine/histidine transport system permease subunit
MSDISLNWGFLDYATIALLLSWPGALSGLLIGAIACKGHRVLGGALGALAGLALLVAYWIVYAGSNLSLSEDPAQAVFTSMRIAWPGMTLGCLVGTAVWRGRRMLGAILGTPSGFILWLYGWWYLA